MAAITKDRAKTWNIAGDSKVWTLAETATIDVYGAPAIMVATGNDSNSIVVNGDIDATGAGSVGIFDEADKTKITIAETAMIRASTGVLGAGSELAISNNGEIHAAFRGIEGDHAFTLANSGTIYAPTAVYALEGGVIRNAKGAELWGGNVGVDLVAGDGKLVNHGFITGYTGAIADGAGNSTIVNRGRIEGDVTLGDGMDVFDTRGGTIQGTVSGGLGSDRYVLSAPLTISEKPGEGTDAVETTVSFTLPANVDDLRLGGKADIKGMGNADPNDITGNAGNNVLNGRAGDDTLRGEAGDDILFGGDGSDHFMIFPGGGIDTIKDFAHGVDHIGIYNFAEAADFDSLTIRQGALTGGNVWIELGAGQRIVVEGIDKSVLDSSDFWFV